jgi:hypothetical protein
MLARDRIDASHSPGNINGKPSCTGRPSIIPRVTFDIPTGGGELFKHARGDRTRICVIADTRGQRRPLTLYDARGLPAGCQGLSPQPSHHGKVLVCAGKVVVVVYDLRSEPGLGRSRSRSSAIAPPFSPCKSVGRKIFSSDSLTQPHINVQGAGFLPLSFIDAAKALCSSSSSPLDLA